jgi:hypothetical protein
MLQIALKYSLKAFAALMLLMTSIAARAQDKVEIDTQEVKSWFETNWIWVVAGIVLLLLIVLVSRRSSPPGNRTTISGGERKTTTVVKDAQGNVQSVTTTEEKI